jgi:iron(III) transport system substrate-binding protein
MVTKKMLRCLVILGIFCFWLIIPSLQAATPLTVLYDKAKQEGELMCWTPGEVVPLIVPKFNKRFPGIKVTNFEIQATEAAQRILMEARAGKTNADVLQISIRKDVILLMERDLVAKYDWSKLFGDFGLTKDNIFLDGYALTFFDQDFPLLYNTNLVSPKDVPRSLDDLLNPKWQGKILLEQRLREWGYYAIKWNDDQFKQFANKLKLQKPRFLRGGPAVWQQLAAGDAALASGGYGHEALVLKSKGAPIDLCPVSPTGAGTRGLAILKNAPHPAAAQLFTAWVSSPEGQQALQDATEQGTLGPNSTLKLAKIYHDRGTEILFESKANIDRIEYGVKMMQEALGIK